jgi:hypothetical protein
MSDADMNPNPKPKSKPKSKRTPPRPADLGKAGAKLWREIITTGAYDLRPDELRILEDACREADLIDEMEVARRELPYMVKGSQGQDVINPIISELRQHRATLTSMLAKLKLPDDAEDDVGGRDMDPRATAARKAANARWNKSACSDGARP